MASMYNENDPHADAWLRSLIAAELLPGGHVDERSIADLDPSDCAPTSHFFAGIGGWPYALQLAGWPAGRDVWTGSCPCQPLSGAGKQRGHEDARHLWPEWFRLIRQCRPPTIFGEQVASSLGREWLAGVRADLESLGYAFGAADLCAPSVGAPHIRQRLFWVADAGSPERRSGADLRPRRRGQDEAPPEHAGVAQGLADAERGGRRTDASRPERDGRDGQDAGREKAHGIAGTRGAVRGMADPYRHEVGARITGDDGSPLGQAAGETTQQASPWSGSRVIECRDGKLRRIAPEPEFFPLAHGVPARVVRLRGYGNAIVPQVTAAFVRSFLSDAETT